MTTSTWGLTVVTEPVEEPVTLAETKEHVREDRTIEDNILTTYIIAAREHCEAFCKRVFVTTVSDVIFDHFPNRDTGTHHPAFFQGRNIFLPRPRLQTVDSIKYIDTDGVEQTWSSSNYVVDVSTEPGRVFPIPSKVWPETESSRDAAVTIRFTHGYGSAANVPSIVKLAIMQTAAHWYRHREPIMAGSVPLLIPMHVKALLADVRVPFVA